MLLKVNGEVPRVQANGEVPHVQGNGEVPHVRVAALQSRQAEAGQPKVASEPWCVRTRADRVSREVEEQKGVSQPDANHPARWVRF